MYTFSDSPERTSYTTPTCPLKSTDAWKTPGWCSFRKYIMNCTIDQALELEIRMLTAGGLETFMRAASQGVNARATTKICIEPKQCLVHYIGRRRHKRKDQQMFYLETILKENLNTEATLRKRRVHETSGVCDFWRTRGSWEVFPAGAVKGVNEVSPGRPQSFRYLSWQQDDRSSRCG